LSDAEYPLLENAIDIYCGQLTAAGLTPDTDRADTETNIAFRYDDEDFYLELDNADLQSVRFTLSYELTHAKKENRIYLVDTALDNTAACTAVATLIDEDHDVVFRYDAFIGPTLDISPVLTRILDALQDAQERFFTQLG
jgi:hypothetical protein